MIEKYNLDEFNNTTHTIRVTFMYEDYIGHISYKISGNCRGADLLDANFLEYTDQEDIDKYVENDCELKVDEDWNIFSIVLHSPDGGTFSFEGKDDELQEFIVAIEIVAVDKDEVKENG